MAVTIAPSVEACTALVDRINSGTAYTLDDPATFADMVSDSLEDVYGTLKVDVIPENEEQLQETLNVEDRTSHTIRVWMRKHVDNQDDIDALKLIARQLFQRLNNFNSADDRVRVWSAEMDPKEVPAKTPLQTRGLFMASVLTRVEVEAS